MVASTLAGLEVIELPLDSNCRSAFDRVLERLQALTPKPEPHPIARTPAVPRSQPPGECAMKPNVLLVVTSMLSILLISFHIAEDIVLGFTGRGLSNLIAIGILVVYSCGALTVERAAVGLDHPPARIARGRGDTGRPHDRSGSRCPPVGGSVLFRLDPLCAWRDRDVRLSALDARALEVARRLTGSRSVRQARPTLR